MGLTALQAVPPPPQPSPSSPSRYPPTEGLDSAGSEPGAGSLIFWILVLIVLLYLANYVYEDARKRGIGSPLLWSLLVFFIPPVGVTLYALAASTTPTQDTSVKVECSNCGVLSDRDCQFCSNCGSELPSPTHGGSSSSGELSSNKTPENLEFNVYDIVGSGAFLLGIASIISAIIELVVSLFLFGLGMLSISVYILFVLSERREEEASQNESVGASSVEPPEGEYNNRILILVIGGSVLFVAVVLFISVLLELVGATG